MFAGIPTEQAIKRDGALTGIDIATNKLPRERITRGGKPQRRESINRSGGHRVVSLGERRLDRAVFATDILVDVVQAEVPARIRRGSRQGVELAEVRPQGVPVPAGAAKMGPGVHGGLGVGHEGLAVDGAGPAEELALGQVDDFARQCFLCFRSARPRPVQKVG